MIKVSAERSIMRRMALTKAADDYADVLRGYAASHRPGLVRAGVQTAVNDNLRKTRTPTARPQAGRSAGGAARR